MMKELSGMIEKLDDSIKIPFMMHYRGYKYQEIADHFQLPLGTIKSRIFFTRKELKELINTRYDNTGELRNQLATDDTFHQLPSFFLSFRVICPTHFF